MTITYTIQFRTKQQDHTKIIEIITLINRLFPDNMFTKTEEEIAQ